MKNESCRVNFHKSWVSRVFFPLENIVKKENLVIDPLSVPFFKQNYNVYALEDLQAT